VRGIDATDTGERPAKGERDRTRNQANKKTSGKGEKNHCRSLSGKTVLNRYEEGRNQDSLKTGRQKEIEKKKQ